MASFPSVRIEGGLLGPDLLDELVAGDLPGQRPSEFGLDGRRNLTAELAAAFADARAYWGAFGHRLERLQEDNLATTPTRDAWVVPLLGLLGYELHLNRRAHEVDGLTYAISHRAGEAEEAPPVHIVGARQELGRLPPSGRPRLAPHSLVQEYLNRTEQVWGLVTNGLVLRLLRNSTLVRRQAYVEFDLRQMLEEQRFADFAVLYRLMHGTRLPRGAAGAEECLLDRYYAHSREQGDRVREHLREGVEDCIQRLANGFLRHPANDELRRRVTADHPEKEEIPADDLYRQLLRLVYRLLFLLVSEDRGLLSPDHVYREHYGVARLRRVLDHRAAFTDHDDIWQSLRVLWRVLSKDRLAEILRLAPLNGELFVPQELDHFTLSNRDLLEAFWYLAWYQEKAAPPRRVNYAALDVEELGSIYESLLDFHPAIDSDAAGWPVFDLIEGSERKTTGSYYTPPQLVAELIKSALEPIIADRLAAAPAGEREGALLSIRVCDPACGSGHFLLAAARRIGKVLAQERTGEEEPAPERVREAIRDVIAHCIYGVDRNPLAVDLCRVALWLESHTGGKPLTFLDHRIRCGDSLIGVFDLASLERGIPDEAFKPVAGDDKPTVRALARRNRDEREGQHDLFAWDPDAVLTGFTRATRTLHQIGDDTPEAVRRKKEVFELSHADPAWRRQHEACDLWTAAFFQPMRADAPAITSGTLADHLAGRTNSRLVALAWELSLTHRFFHWPLEFPEVLADGGFDVVLANPPWGQKAIKADPRLKRFATTAFTSSVGIFDFFRPFVELAVNIVRPGTNAGLVLPDILLLKNYQETRAFLLRSTSIRAISWWRQPFRDAVIDVAMITLRREVASADHTVAIRIHESDQSTSHSIQQSAFQKSDRQTFNLFLTDEIRSFLDAFADKPRLGAVFEVHEGVHSGNIRKELFVDTKRDESCRPLIQSGSELKPHLVEWRNRYIRLSAVPPKRTSQRYANLGRPDWHEAAKVLVRRTADRIIAAVDAEGRYVSNNLFLIIQKEDCSMDLWGLCALLNSSLISSYFQAVEPREGRVFAEVKIKHLSHFPIPVATKSKNGCNSLNRLGAIRAKLASKEGTSDDADLVAQVEEVDLDIECEVARLFGLSFGRRV